MDNRKEKLQKNLDTLIEMLECHLMGVYGDPGAAYEMSPEEIEELPCADYTDSKTEALREAIELVKKEMERLK